MKIELKWSDEMMTEMMTTVRSKSLVPARMKIASINQLPVGRALTFEYRGHEALLVHLAPGELRAYYRQCPHKGSLLTWDESTGTIRCQVHDAVFDPVTGAPRKGPTAENIRPIGLELIDGDVFTN